PAQPGSAEAVGAYPIRKRLEMDLARLHPQARAALGVQQRVPLTLDGLPDARRSMIDATPAEVGAGPRLQAVDVDADGVPARLYRNRTHNASPVILYAHGGGWVMGNLDTHDGLCRHLAAVSGWAVLAVDYRLAPEHPYPAAIDDMAHALDWLHHTATTHQPDPDLLSEEGERYAAQLFNAEVPVISARYQGLIHNFPRKLALFDAAHTALAQVATALHRW